MSELIIGLTGGIGCGKSTVTTLFENLGVDAIDADIVAREVVAPKSEGLAAIVEKFGKGFLLESGELDRAKLRSEIFSNDASKNWLNQLLHPLIRTSIEQQISACTSPYCLLVAPLLIENNLLHLIDRVLVIDVDEATQLTRTLARDPSSEKEIKAIIASQVTRSQRRQAADDILDNSSTDLKILKDNVALLHSKYLALVTSANT
ncbi:dephospho-CoA kinase [Thalassotalea sp. PLHSN55]|uniref:dephospho-CoA kinase n=1 Tax=Thalassotalea sp. PLHSN55 TaxID=3435888 RepID=UPI003F824B79